MHGLFLDNTEELLEKFLPTGLHKLSVHSAREVMKLGLRADAMLETVQMVDRIPVPGTDAGPNGTIWHQLAWLRRERERLLAGMIEDTGQDRETTIGEFAFVVPFYRLTSSGYWNLDYGWTLQRIRNWINLRLDGAFLVTAPTVLFENEQNAMVFKAVVEALPL